MIIFSWRSHWKEYRAPSGAKKSDYRQDGAKLEK